MSKLNEVGRSVRSRTVSAVKAAFRHLGVDMDLGPEVGLRTIRPTDTFIVSYPKSGNTWVRFLLANTILGDRVATFHDLDELVPDVHKYRARIELTWKRRLIKTHYAFCSHYPRFVYICRDGRDALVSFYHYQMQRGQFSGSFSEFIRSRQTNIFGRWRWHEHVSEALREKDRRPDDVIFLRYEDMLSDPFAVAPDLVAFCGIEASSDRVANAVRNCSFEKLRDIETSYGGLGDVERFMRKGKSNQWPGYFSRDDLEYFYGQARRTMTRVGYI